MKRAFAAVVASIAVLACGQFVLAGSEQRAKFEAQTSTWAWEITCDYLDNNRWHRWKATP